MNKIYGLPLLNGGPFYRPKGIALGLTALPQNHIIKRNIWSLFDFVIRQKGLEEHTERMLQMKKRRWVALLLSVAVLLSLGVFERVLTIEQKDGKRSYRMEKTEGTTC